MRILENGVMDTKHVPHGSDSACAGCAVNGRRQFLRDAAVMVAGTLVALGALPAHAAALETRFIRGVHTADQLKSYAIPATDSVNIDEDQSVIIARTQGKLFAFSLACPHQNTALRWDPADQEFHCPKHHSEYTADGVFIDGRATRSMDRFAVQKNGASVTVDLDKLYQEDSDPDLWKAAFLTL
ncbi:MAG: QcrA and Rieske domain-containing protein [Gemmatimonadaceae bacterium]